MPLLNMDDENEEGAEEGELFEFVPEELLLQDGRISQELNIYTSKKRNSRASEEYDEP